MNNKNNNSGSLYYFEQMYLYNLYHATYYVGMVPLHWMEAFAATWNALDLQLVGILSGCKKEVWFLGRNTFGAVQGILKIVRSKNASA